MAAQLKLTQLFETKSLKGYNLNSQIMDLLFRNFRAIKSLYGY